MAVAAGQGTPQNTAPRDISELALEDLMQLTVTSASNKEQPLSKVGAALFVLTREDIASSGATNIPDLLRLVPGVDVAQINTNQWAISIRGSNGVYANKVLALIDGRALYQPSFSAVVWDQQDLPLEDIERIEVIRGPGGTIWGANAMNGVINIITRHSRDTQGGLITAGTGSSRQGDGVVQYGGKIGSSGTYRAFGKYFDVDSSVLPGGLRANDSWHSWAGGFRSDWDLTPRDTLTVQGDLKATVAGGATLATYSEPTLFQAVINFPFRNTLGNVMGTWRHTLEGGSETTLRVYYDHTDRIGETGSEFLNDVVDADFIHHVALGARHDVVWGVNFQMNRNELRPMDSHSSHLVPPQNTTQFASGFFQDEIRLTNSLFLTVGSKLEHNDFTGFEYEPGVQLAWTPSARHTLWTSAARAIRQPNVGDVNVRLNLGVQFLGSLPALLTISGNSSVKAEQLYDYEAGYRGQIDPRLGLDLSTFLGYYHDLETFEAGAPLFVANPDQAPYLVLPLTYGNLARAGKYGGELFFHWSAARRWTLSPGYSYLHMSVQTLPGSTDFFDATIPGNSPKHQIQVRSVVRLRANVDWNATLRYVSRLPTPGIDAYVTADTTLRWRPRDDLEVSVTGQNLLSPGRLEFTHPVLTNSLVQRSVFAKMTWRF